MNKKLCIEIIENLKQTYPDAKCSLDFSTPFELLIAVMLSAQCTDDRVNKTTPSIFAKYNTPEDFAKMDLSLLENLIHPCGFYKNKAKNIKKMSKDLIEKYNGEVPSTIEELMALSGVGRKTANVVLSEGFKKNAFAVDTHVFRVSHRLSLSKAKTADKTEFDLKQVFDENLWSEIHFYMVLFGRYICKSQRPKCEECKLKQYCQYYKEKKDVY